MFQENVLIIILLNYHDFGLVIDKKLLSIKLLLKIICNWTMCNWTAPLQLMFVIWIWKLLANFTDCVALATSFHRCSVEHFVSLSLWLSVKLNKVDARCLCLKRTTRRSTRAYDARCRRFGGPANDAFDSLMYFNDLRSILCALIVLSDNTAFAILFYHNLIKQYFKGVLLTLIFLIVSVRNCEIITLSSDIFVPWDLLL